MRSHLIRALRSLALVAALSSPTAAIDVAPGNESFYIVGPPIALPDVNATDVAIAGASIFVGQGGFGAGQQSILRIDPDGTMTTVVTNLNALGGMAYDVATDRLLFTDNGGDLVGATSGDTIYALSSPRAVAAALDAATLTLLPSGTIPFAQAVALLPSGDVLVGDAAGPGSGRVVKISGGVPSDFITGLDYVAGISTARNYVSPGGVQEIHVGNVDGTFTPSLTRYALAGTSLGSVNATPISGALDHAATAAGNILLTGGFTNDFSSSTIAHVVQAGAVGVIATGFGFSSGITIDGPSQQVLALDFGVPRIDTLVSVAYLTPGAFGKRECNLETWGGRHDVGGNGRARPSWTCTDGDFTCDRDLVVDGTCAFQVGACARVLDLGRIPKCTPVDVATVTVTSKHLPIAASAMQSAASAIVPATAPTCSETRPVVVPADRKTRTITFDARAADGKRLDKDALKLRCLPAV